MKSIEETLEILEDEKVNKVRCIDKEATNLTFKKEYEVLEERELKSKDPYNAYLIVDDGGNKSLEPDCLFEEVEDKVIRVRCIENGNMEHVALKIGKIYAAMESKTINGAYQILKDDKGRKNMNFSKNWFEKVEDVLMVECIDNKEFSSRLMMNEKYRILDEDSKQYKIVDEIGEITWFDKSRFKPVLKEKEVKKINYEEEYKKVKEELEDAEKHYSNAIDEYNDKIKQITEENEGLKSENKKLNERITLKEKCISNMREVIKKLAEAL